MALKESGEMYLETILILSKTKKDIRAIDIGEYMGFSKPSVSRALKLLKEDSLISVEDNGNISLLPSGKKIAKKIYERHQILTNVLVKLGVDEKTASIDACKIEHDISDKSFNAIKKHLK